MSQALFKSSSASWTFLLLPLFAVGHNLYLLSPTTWHDTNPKTYLSHFFLTFWRHSCWTHRYECLCNFSNLKTFNIKHSVVFRSSWSQEHWFVLHIVYFFASHNVFRGLLRDLQLYSCASGCWNECFLYELSLLFNQLCPDEIFTDVIKFISFTLASGPPACSHMMR